MKGNHRLLMFLAAATCLGLPGTAAAGPDNCGGVTIVIKNNRAKQIKVTALRYYDYDAEKWRHETTWTPLRIASTAIRERRRDLERVRNDRTKIKIKYRTHQGGSSWAGPYSKTTNVFTCRRRGRVRIQVP